jgi:hypothetical protein
MLSMLVASHLYAGGICRLALLPILACVLPMLPDYSLYAGYDSFCPGSDGSARWLVILAMLTG